jgi:hypothetical protein
MGYLEDTTWEDDNETHPADIAAIVGRVVKCPPKLYYNEDDPHNSMPWDTDMELKIGDLVWFNLIESLNANEIEVDDKIVRIIPYTDVYVAKRPDKRLVDQVICLNGYVLLAQIPLPKLSDLDVTSEEKIYEDRGGVRYLGTPNRAYIDKNYSDDIDIEVGDMAYLKPGYKPFNLERKSYMSEFTSTGELFYCVQRRRIILSV